MLHEHNRGSWLSFRVFYSEETELVPIFCCNLVALVIESLILSQFEKVLEEVRVLSLLVLLSHPSSDGVLGRVNAQNEGLLLQFSLKLSFARHWALPRFTCHLVARIYGHDHLVRGSFLHFFLTIIQQTCKNGIKERLWGVFPLLELEELAALHLSWVGEVENNLLLLLIIESFPIVDDLLRCEKDLVPMTLVEVVLPEHVLYI